MSSTLAAITISVDGYIAAPNDGPGMGLGEDGERLHYWVFGGPWRYEDDARPDPQGIDAEWMQRAQQTMGAVIAGRGTYEAARHWGDRNPWSIPCFVVTHHPEEEPSSGEFSFVGGLSEAVAAAREAAGERDVHVMGGAQTIRQALEGGFVDRLTIIVAPVILGAGKRLFEGFSRSLELEHLGVTQSQYATFIDYRVRR